MAAPKVKFKRSSVAGKIPALSNLETGELALNTYDGKLFLKVDTGGIGIGTTVSAVNPWVENYGATGISYSGNINVTGVSTFHDTVNLGQSDKLLFNGTNGLEIYENGTVGVIQANNTSGRITIEVNNNGGGASAEIIQLRGSGNLISANFKPDSGVQLYGRTGSNSAEIKLETNSTGVDVTGDLTLTDTDAGSSAGPELKLYRNSASPADADYLGQIKFAGESDTGVERNYAKITGKILDASNGTEDGIIEFAHIKAGSQNISARFRSDSLQLLNGTSLTVNGSSTFTGNILANSDSTVDIGTNSTRFANVYADTYYGDGSQLTGISAGAASTSNVSSNTTISGIITASDQFYPPTLTTSERDALTVTQGALIFNTTENKVQMYLGSEWKSLAFELDTYTAIGI